MKILEGFLRCPNCRRLKNYNYTPKTVTVTVKCFCGTVLTKKLNYDNNKI